MLLSIVVIEPCIHWWLVQWTVTCNVQFRITLFHLLSSWCFVLCACWRLCVTSSIWFINTYLVSLEAKLKKFFSCFSCCFDILFYVLLDDCVYLSFMSILTYCMLHDNLLTLLEELSDTYPGLDKWDHVPLILSQEPAIEWRCFPKYDWLECPGTHSRIIFEKITRTLSNARCCSFSH